MIGFPGSPVSNGIGDPGHLIFLALVILSIGKNVQVTEMMKGCLGFLSTL